MIEERDKRVRPRVCEREGENVREKMQMRQEKEKECTHDEYINKL